MTDLSTGDSLNLLKLSHGGIVLGSSGTFTHIFRYSFAPSAALKWVLTHFTGRTLPSCPAAHLTGCGCVDKRTNLLSADTFLFVDEIISHVIQPQRQKSQQMNC